MSKLSQELKTLFYLNDHYSSSSYVSVRRIAEHLDVSQRQARRYLEDLSNNLDLVIETCLGRDGGYRLAKPLDHCFTLPQNLALALSIAMKRNEHVESVLSTLPNYVITDFVEGDNYIDNKTFDNIEILTTAIRDRRNVTFHYRDDEERLHFVDPYKVVYTNKTYYLYAVNDDQLKHYDCSLMKDIKVLGGYKPEKKFEQEALDSLGRYGVRSGSKATLRVKCVDENALRLFDKYFERKGVMDVNNLTYEVTGNDEHELFYPLFRISTKKYVFLDETFKEHYLTYLKNQIKSIEGK